MEKQQKVAAVICEYNPFHYGHAHQINIMKESFDVCIGVMSGAYVQRGTVATHDKYARAEAAVKAGLDLVVELPFPYCCCSAADFARSGVHIASALGASHLVFGAEDAGNTFLRLAESKDAIDEEARRLMEGDESLSFPKAVTLAAARLGGDEWGAAVSKPNNILGLEYAKAIKEGAYPLQPYPILRKAGLASSTELRAMEDFCSDIPYPENFTESRRDLAYVERWLIHLLRHGSYRGLYCIDAPLAAALKKAAMASATLEELVASATSKVYTSARVRRAVLAAWLKITKEEVKALPVYTNLLAANKRGTEYLGKIKKSCSLSIVTKPASYKELSFSSSYQKALQAEDCAALCSQKMTEYSSPLCKTPKIYTFNT